MAPISNDWLQALKPEYGKSYYKSLYQFVNDEYRAGKVFPPGNDIFNAFHYTPLAEVRAVILGQDP